MKSYSYHVTNGANRTIWGGNAHPEVSVSSSPTFSMEVDGGLGPLSITTDLPFGYDGADLQNGNIIDTYCEDDRGVRLVHSGVLERVDQAITAAGETTTVSVMPWVKRLSLDHVRGLGTAISFSWSATDVSEIMKDILDSAIAQTGSFRSVTYSPSSIQTSGKDVSIAVGSETYLSAIQRVKKLGPGNWYWHVRADGTFSYRSFDSGTKHIFTRGADFTNLRRTRDITDLRNTVYFWNTYDTDDYIAFERPATESRSQTLYGRRVHIETDSHLDHQPTAEGIADAFIEERELPIESFEMTVTGGEDGYNIESIMPGDVCEIRNVPALSGRLLSILRVDYSPASVTLQLGDGPVRRQRTFGMAIDEMAAFLRNYHGAKPADFTP